MEGRPYKMPEKKRPRRWLERAAIWLGLLLIVSSFALTQYRWSVPVPSGSAPNVGTPEHRRDVAAAWQFKDRLRLIEGAMAISGFLLALWGGTVEQWRDATDFS